MAATTVVGVLASLASISLAISPARDVYDIDKTLSVTERSILPYCMMMVDGANWVVYASLVDDCFPIGVTNAVGCTLGTAYSVVYLRTCSHDKRDGVRRRAWTTFAAALTVVGLVAVSALSLAIVRSSDTAADSIGIFVDLFNVCLYASPLSIAWKVFLTGSTSGMYLPMSIAMTQAAALWATYGFLISDWYVAMPQSAGLLAGLGQLALFLWFGVADNNQPSDGATAAMESAGDPWNAPASRVMAAGDGEKHGGGGGPPVLSGSCTPVGISPPNISGNPGRGRGREQLREPLISGI